MTDFTGAQTGTSGSVAKEQLYEFSTETWEPKLKETLSLVCTQRAVSYSAVQQSSGLLVVTFYNTYKEAIATYTNVSYVKEL